MTLSDTYSLLGQEGLKRKVDLVLREVDAIVYVLDVTKLKTDDEAELIRRLRQNAIEPNSKKIFFVLNRIDLIQGDPAKVQKEAVDYVSELFQIPSAKIFPISAFRALLSYQILGQQMPSEDTRREFGNLIWGVCDEKDISDVATMKTKAPSEFIRLIQMTVQ